MLSMLREISLGNRIRIITSLEQSTMRIFNLNRVVEITQNFRKILHLHKLVFHPPSFYTIRMVQHQAISLGKVFQAPEPTQLVQSMVETIRASVLYERNRCFTYVPSGYRLRYCPYPNHGLGGNNSRAKSTTSVEPVGRPTKQGNSLCTSG